jgi:hypothetical protein
MHQVLAALKSAIQLVPLNQPRLDWAHAVIDKAQDLLDNGCGQNSEFESFWKIYPRKVGKPAAARAWMRMDGDKHWELIRANINSRIASKQWERTPERVQYIPHPTTYLNQRRWLDEGLPVSQSGWRDV